MSWVTVIWSMTASACLTMAGIHFLVWCQRRTAWAELVFTLTAGGVAVFAGVELWMMRAETVEQFAAALRWIQVPTWVIVVSLAGFVRLHLRAGRRWLAWSIIALRSLALLLNFLVGQNLNYREVTRLRHIRFLGETASVGVGVSNPWMLVGQLSLLLLVIFTLDATMSVWRRGDRRRAVVTGGGIVFFAVTGMAQAVLVLWQMVDMPLTESFFFLGIVVAMGYEMSGETLRAAQLSEELLESQQRMRLAASAANLSLWEWDIVRDEVWVTKAGRERAGAEGSERVDFAHFLQLIHPDDREPTQRAMQHSLEVSGGFEAEYRVVSRDGAARWFAARGQVERDRNGKPLWMRGVSVDVTERRSADEKFRLAVEASPSGIVLVDGAGRIVLVNAESEKLFGYSREELLGQTVEMLIPERFRGMHPPLREGFQAAPKARAMGAGRELFARCKDGTEFPVEIGLSPIRSEEGILVLTVIVDIRARRESEREIAEQRNQLTHLSRVNMLGELAGSLAHELNQPLTAVLSNAQAAQRFLAHEPIDLNEVRDILADIVAEDKRAGEVIRRLRLLLKKGEVQDQPLQVNEVVQEALKLVRSDLVNHNFTANMDLAPHLPMVQGDRVQLQQVLVNLVMNGCDAMADAGRGNRQVTVRTGQAEDGAVCISVADRGTGIAAEKLEQVFEPFYTTKSHGMGLGLAVCRTIVTAHGGKLWATNNPGRGATFHFTLPLSRWSADRRSLEEVAG